MPKLRYKQFLKILPLITLSLGLAANTSYAQDQHNESSQTLVDLYQSVKKERKLQKDTDAERENFFKDQKKAQKEALKELKSELSRKQAALKSIKKEVAANKVMLQDAETQLAERSHALKDLFSVWKQAVKDGKSNTQASVISHQHPILLAQYREFARQSAQPDAKALQALFSLLQRDIQLSGKSLSYEGEVIGHDGQSTVQPIQRIGSFSITSQGQFLVHNPAENTLVSLPKQPPASVQQVTKTADYQNLQHGSLIQAVIDPSHGVVLEQLAYAPSWEERFHQGGYIGYVIVALGMAGLLLSLIRWAMISHSQVTIRRQMARPDTIDTRNPLGRIISVYQESIEHSKVEENHDRGLAHEALEVQLQEIVVSEMPKLDRGLGTIKLLAAIAPLLGLLGTVVGMINTFQSITLVGNADPKLMAGGISQALMTTVLGLIVAVPLLFSHNLLAAKTRKVVMFLTQQSLGFIAQYLNGSKPTKTHAATQKDVEGN